VAFESADWHSKDLVATCVLQTLMGGGGSFSAGGPGKGMTSRLYENVLNQHGWVESASSFNLIYNDSGLFGVYGSCQATHLGSLADVFAKELTRMAGPLTDTEFSRAKNQLKANGLMQLETRSMQLEDIGRQLLTYNKVATPAETCALVDSVTKEDVSRVARTLLKKKPAIAGLGNLSYLPSYQELASHFG
jgi:processing peptidase subunit alpha